MAHLQALERTPRAQRPADVEYGEAALPGLAKLPSQQDLWTPPIGVQAQRLVTASVEDSCFFLGTQAQQRGVIYAMRNNQTYLMCDSEVDCKGYRNLSKLGAAGVPKMSQFVFHATANVWVGVYHMLVTSVPSLMPYLSDLRAGSMKVFFHSQRALVSPLLGMLGLEDAAFFPPSELPLKHNFQFCTDRMIFNSPLKPGQDFVVPHLHQLRVLLRRRHWLKADPTARKIVVLSRGNSSRSLTNEGEMLDALKVFGLPVDIVQPSAENLSQTMDALNQAAVVVGAHGANLANIAFAPAGVGVVEIVPQVPFNMVNHHFRSLAGGLGLRYIPVGAPATDFDVTRTHDPMLMDKAIRSYKVDVTKVVAAVESLL